MEIEFGKIAEICPTPKDANGDPTTCRVIPSRNEGVTTQPLYIPFYWRARLGNLQVDEEVCYAVKGNGQGVVLSRLDGEWDGVIRNTTAIKAEGDIEVQGSAQIAGNTTVGGSVDATGTVKGLEVQNITGTKLGTHLHPTAVPGPTTPPTPGS
jgi:hypothetical protein